MDREREPRERDPLMVPTSSSYTEAAMMRRPSHAFLDTPIGSFKGPNTLGNFAESFTRAQSFAASRIDNDIHHERSFFDPDNSVFEDELIDTDLMVPSVRGERLSMISSRSSMISALKREVDGVVLVKGQSTAPQTVFNSINVLIGVGLLALPVGILNAGWVLGVPILMACGVSTWWSARSLSRAMDTDATIMTYADLGYASYGSQAKLLISLVFSIDLLGAGVALIILFSDSLAALFSDSGWTHTQFKLLAFVVLTPFTFMPLRVLSVFSLLGILSTISITILVVVCGLLKPSSPGSLLEFMPTNMWPESNGQLLIAIGILMAPFGGHAIFPNLKSDMRHPYKFERTLGYTYVITVLTDVSMGVVGFLMFGPLCNNEITNNILLTAGYPRWMYPVITCLLCIVPLAKTPLNAKPIISTLESVAAMCFPSSAATWTSIIIKIAVNAGFVTLACLFPEFDKIIGILGASICFLVCIILPGMFYLKLCKPTYSEKLVVRFAVLVAGFLGALATYAIVAF
ncbi:vacuolar amino acid transporter 1 [Diutina catenulata]